MLPNTDYNVFVVASDGALHSPPSNASVTTTLEAAPSAPPRAVRATAPAAPAALAVSWAPPSLDAQRGVVVAYTLRIQRLRDSSDSPAADEPMYVQVNGTTTSTALTGLDIFTWYQVRMRARKGRDRLDERAK